jgi:hypothetical protein
MARSTGVPTWLLAGATGTVFAASVIGVVAVHPPPPEHPVTAPPAASTTLAPPASAEPPTTAAAAPAATAPAVAGVTAPKAGAYTYARTNGTGKPSTATTTSTRPKPTTTTRAPKRGKPAATTTTTVPVGTRSDESRRTVAVTRSGPEGGVEVGQESGTVQTGSGEASTTDTVAWGAAGVVVRETAVRLFGGSFTCDWQPDWAQVAPNPAVGVSWTTSATCTGVVRGGQLDGAQAQMKRKDTHVVRSAQPEAVAGRTVATLTIAASSDLELTAGDLGFTSHSDGTERFAPELGISVGSTVTTNVQSFGGTRTSVITEQLVALP